MKEDFIIRIKSRTEQFDHMQPVRTGEDDRIEIMTYGSLVKKGDTYYICLLYTSPSPRDCS